MGYYQLGMEIKGEKALPGLTAEIDELIIQVDLYVLCKKNGIFFLLVGANPQYPWNLSNVLFFRNAW